MGCKKDRSMDTIKRRGEIISLVISNSSSKHEHKINEREPEQEGYDTLIYVLSFLPLSTR